jgi:hypothetical protein
MITSKLSVAATVVLSFIVCAPALALAHTNAHHAVAATSDNTPGTRWKTDAAMREGMGRIRREVLGLEHYQHGHIGPQQAVILADDIERDVGFVVAHCTLAPKADHALHPILAGLMRGAQSIKSKPADLSAIAPMRRALVNYALQFDDPDPNAAE